jgi:glycine/D-amino acid oxidase-like deaminating enzyme
LPAPARQLLEEDEVDNLNSPAIATQRAAESAGAPEPPTLFSLSSVDGVFVCAGHGPWGISTGPASAALVVDAILERALAALPSELAVDRTRGDASSRS